jgi:membrane protein insertase Oxa1/YidC/SpoIIIJ
MLDDQWYYCILKQLNCRKLMCYICDQLICNMCLFCWLDTVESKSGIHTPTSKSPGSAVRKTARKISENLQPLSGDKVTSANHVYSMVRNYTIYNISSVQWCCRHHIFIFFQQIRTLSVCTALKNLLSIIFLVFLLRAIHMLHLSCANMVCTV